MIILTTRMSTRMIRMITRMIGLQVRMVGSRTRMIILIILGLGGAYFLGVVLEDLTLET